MHVTHFELSTFDEIEERGHSAPSHSLTRLWLAPPQNGRAKPRQTSNSVKYARLRRIFLSFLRCFLASFHFCFSSLFFDKKTICFFS